MFGQAHSQAGILIEPTAGYAIDIDDEKQLIKFRNLIWLVHSLNTGSHGVYSLNPCIFRPIISEANKESPSFSKIYKEMILVTDKKRPLPRAGKGTLLRKAALKDYHEEIEKLLVFFSSSGQSKAHRLTCLVSRYASVESSDNSESIAPPALWDKENITRWLLEHVRELNEDKDIPPSADLFEHGFDR